MLRICVLPFFLSVDNCSRCSAICSAWRDTVFCRAVICTKTSAKVEVVEMLEGSCSEESSTTISELDVLSTFLFLEDVGEFESALSLAWEITRSIRLSFVFVCFLLIGRCCILFEHTIFGEHVSHLPRYFYTQKLFCCEFKIAKLSHHTTRLLC
jgi:hypothetical protein